MTDSTGPGPEAGRQARPPHPRVIRGILQVIGSTAALVAIYYVAPDGSSSTWAAVTVLAIGLLIFVGLVAFQARSILRSPFPEMRAIESLATSASLFLLLFASTYFVMSRLSAGSFSEPLTRTDALYFTITVFSTVGFGDITAKTDAARLVVTAQMIADLVILGLGIRIILGAVKRGRNRQPEDADGS